VLYWIIKTLILGPWLKVLFRPWVEGQENMPVSGGMILASNHLSFSDSFYLALPVKRPMAYLAKSDYFTGKGIKGYLSPSCSCAASASYPLIVLAVGHLRLRSTQHWEY
jgi:1-acyl-sn-glycerol-3-phosphate acyltransferase